MKEEEVEIVREVDLSLLSWPDREIAGNLREEDYFARGYIDLRRRSWKEAKEALELEEKLFRDWQEQSGKVTFDEYIDQISEDDDLWPLFGLDPGVASAVLSLSASGCIPVTSCNGEDKHLERYPIVLFWLRKERVIEILQIAEVSECGLVHAENGWLGQVLLYSTNLLHMMHFAKLLIERRKQLTPIPKRSRHKRNRQEIPYQQKLLPGIE